MPKVPHEILENRGAEPDILAQDSPADRAAERDSQLETAVRTVLNGLALIRSAD